MTSLPNPFTDFAGCVEHIPASSAVASSPQPPGDATASYFDDEPLPLCLTEPHDGIDRDIAAILRVIFGIHTARGMA